jgi:hypothetical protein
MHICQICNKEFRSERSLSGHKSSHNRLNESYKVGRQKVFLDPTAEKPKKYCPYCKQVFDTGWQLGGHVKSCIFSPRVIELNKIKEEERLLRLEECPSLSTMKRGRGIFRSGTYKGFKCDSSWELALLLYSLDNNSIVERNRQSFQYTHEGRTRRYYPDFVIDGKYVEVKGRVRDVDFSKWDQFPHELEIIGADKIHSYIKYSQDKYGLDFIKMYD